MTDRPRRCVPLGTAVAGALLLIAAPAPGAALTTLRAAGSATDPFAPLLAVVALLAWALAGWLALTIATTAGSHLPGQLGRALAVLARRVAPATVRRTVEVALGLTVAVGMLASPAAAAPGTEATHAGSAPAASLDWAAAAPDSATPDTAAPNSTTPDSTAPDTAPPSLDWAAASTPVPARDLDWASGAPRTDVPAIEVGDAVVVRPGDTLWSLAEQNLRDGGAVAPGDAEVAAAWPSWWSANREAVGEDPHLLQPGTRLDRPGTEEPSAGG